VTVKKVRSYLYASSAAEAVSLVRRGPGRGIYVAGATDLFLFMPPDVEFVVDLHGAGLSGITTEGGGDLVIGATATLHEVATSAAVTGFAGGAVAAAADHCGNRQVRSTATIGGNLCSALPSADMAPILLALDTRARLTDGQTTEEVPLAAFFTGPRRSVLGDRVLSALVLPAAAARWRARARKLCRTQEDISLAQVAVSLHLDGPLIVEARVALGAVAPVPLRAAAAEEALAGLKVTAAGTPDAIAAAARLAGARAEPIDDHRASAAYRRAMVTVLTRRLVRELAGLPAATARPESVGWPQRDDRAGGPADGIGRQP
jgi:carbon-monoxide dehydrogenase medium subunit